MKYCSFLILLIFISCNKKTSTTDTNAIVYFDLNKYLNIDIANNQKNNIKEKKEIEINNKKDEQINTNVDWQKEMKLLAECDINKPNWIGKFQVDSAWQNDTTLLSIQCLALDKKIPVKKMTVFFDSNKQPNKIVILKKIKSLLFDTEQQIEYFPAKSFTINAQQKAFFMNDFNSKVSITFIP